MLTRIVLALLEAILSRIPSRAIDRAALAVSWLLFGLLGLRRKVVLKNLDIAFGQRLTLREKKRLAVISTAAFLRTVLEFVGSRSVYSRARVELENREILDAAMAEGRGCLVMGGHQGNWELLCVTGTRQFAPVHMALKPVGGKVLAAWVRARREANGVHEVPRRGERPAWRLMVDALEERHIVAVVVDQRRKKGVVAPLFGKPAQTNVSLFRLWRSHRAPIVPCTIDRLGPDHHRIRFWEPLRPLDDASWDEEEFLRRNAPLLNAQVERMILSNPEEYFWLHDRWKMSR